MPVSADVTDGDPLSGLDDVPWAELQHSYGMAGDVPGHLRAMQAIGLDNNYLPNGCDPREYRDYLARLRGEADDQARRIAGAAGGEQRREREASWAQVLIDAEADVRCYDAVREALPALTVLILELRWASAFALTRFGMTDKAIIDVLTETIARPPAPSETMSFLNGSYRRLAELVLYEITRSPI
jgi:hypothetical protein